MNEQRRQILQMLADGKVTADEAEQLIAALERDQPDTTDTAESRPKGRPKYLRVVVNTTDTATDGPVRVNIRVPIKLLRAGVRLTSLIPPQAVNQVNSELARSGVPVDLGQIKAQDIDELIEHLDDMTIDVDQPDTKVQVFCE